MAETIFQPYAYTARELDSESGLYYYRARFYDPQTGRFLSEDSLRFDAGDQNLYRYVFNNPVNLVDPNGKIVSFCVKNPRLCWRALVCTPRLIADLTRDRVRPALLQ